MHPSFAENLDLQMDDVLVVPERAKPVQAGVPALCRTVAARLLGEDLEFKRYATCKPSPDGLADFVFADALDAQDPRKLFKRMRWGGLCLFASYHYKEVAHHAARFAQQGFAIERGPSYIRDGRWPIPWLNWKVHAFLARKIDLILPGETTNRFTYQVQLDRHNDPNDPIVVRKEVPSLESIVSRLSKKHPDYPT